MIRLTIKTLAVLILVEASASPAQAGCGGGGCRVGGGFGGGFAPRYSAPIHHAPRYVAPVEHAPSYSRPLVSERILSRPVASQPIETPVSFQQPQSQSPVIERSSTRPSIGSQPADETTPERPASALDALAALGSFAPPSTADTTPSRPATPDHIGDWTASLDNGATVSLTLTADGRFTWAATNAAGTSSQFAGRYTVSGGSLSLTRSDASQSLTGRLTQETRDGFDFQLATTNAAKLSFKRS